MNQKVFLFFFIISFGRLGIAQNPTQTIRGIVLNAKTRETLPAANVILLNENIGTITDTEGRFILRDVQVGRYYLQVSYLGYESVVIPELLVSSGKEVVLEVEMEASFSEMEEVVVKPSVRKDRPVNSMSGVSARTFSVEEASRYAGALDDPGRMAGNFAGVTTVGVHLNAIVVRGNAPKGLQWRLEGVDIPVPSHFSGSNVVGGGGLTIFSSRLLANSDFYTGAFPAEYGNATAGVFDMKLRNGNNRRREYAFQAGVQGVEAAAEGPFRNGGEGSYLFNYRYSTMALIFPLLPETRDGNEIPVYQDLSFKLNLPAGRAGTFSLWGIAGLSETTMKGNDEVEKWIYPENRVRMNFHYNMGAGGITHSKTLSKSSHLRSTISCNAGQHYYDKKSRLYEATPTRLIPLYRIRNTSSTATFSSVLTHVYSSRLTVRAGVDASCLFYELAGDARDYEADMLRQIMDGTGHTWLLESYLQGKYMLSRRMLFTAGFNASWFGMRDEVLVEPRLSASWQVHPRHSISLGYGRHSQTEPLFVYFITREDSQTGETMSPNRDLGRMGAHHFVMGYDWSPTEYLRVKIESYYQLLTDVPVIDGTAYSMVNFLSDWTFNKPLVNKGTGTNTGIDITLERFLRDGFYFLTTASLYKSEYTGGDGISRRTRFDGGYVINFLGGKEWQVRNKNLLGINLKLIFMGPYWYQPVDEAASHLASDIVYDENLPFLYRHSGLGSITDAALSYRINGQRLSSILTLQARNIYGSQYLGKRYNLLNKTIENSLFSSPVPFLSYKIEF